MSFDVKNSKKSNFLIKKINISVNLGKSFGLPKLTTTKSFGLLKNKMYVLLKYVLYKLIYVHYPIN